MAVVIAACVALSLGAYDPPVKDDDLGIGVKGTRLDNTKFEGQLDAKTVTVKNDYGTMTYRTAKVKSLSFRHQPDGTGVTVELDDHSRVQGKLQDKTVAATVNGEAVGLEPEQLKVVKFVKRVPVSWVAIGLGLLTLALMEIVLGIDNIIFLAILVGKLPEPQQRSARSIGLAAALGTRILLLFSLSWLLGLTRPLFTLPEMPFLIDPEARDISLRDIILFAGGLFLVYKSVKELHHKIEQSDAPPETPKATAKFATVIFQIALIDIVFSLDSVITAVGMVEEVWVMVVAMVIAMLVMLAFAGPISKFVDRNPAIKVLALSFLILIGVLLIAESLGQHIDKGYIYFAMAFAVGIELINMRLR
jgi:predicted tellurium resistance membrane protein TerC